MPFLATLRKDFAINDKPFTLGNLAFHLLWHSRYNALILIRAFLWLQDHDLPTFLPDLFLRRRYQIEILKPVSIGPELYLPHPFGIVITVNTHIGARCKLYGLVRMLTTPSGSPVVEDDVFLSDGARLVGGVRIGAGSLIGAGAVVTKDIPPGMVAVGVPAKVIKAAAWGKSSGLA